VTRLAVLSDIHGNLPALEAVLNDLTHVKVDHVVLPGDVINWGPFSAQVMERVTRGGWAVIRGNNEFYLLDYQTPRAPVEWNDGYSLLPWLHRQLNGQWQTIIAAWPDTLCLRFPDAPAIRVVHGSPRSAWEPLAWNAGEDEIATRLAGVEETTVIAAHTHLAMDRHVGGWHVLNPGSVGVPLDGVFSASYMLLDGDAEGWTPTFRRVAFDYEPLFEAFERQRFVETCGVIGHLVVEEFRTARLRIQPFVRWRAACCPTAPFEMRLLDEFTQINPWDYTDKAYHVNV
jgi:predicted phosphodiesterase